MKKVLPVIFLVLMAVIAISLKQCNKNKGTVRSNRTEYQSNQRGNVRVNNNSPVNGNGGLDRDARNLFYTKHAKCRMRCRHITQQEVEDILVNGNINYNKSELQDARGPKYAVEGNTNDGQHVRIIFAPTQKHISVVTVIDLEEDFACSCS